MIKVSPPELRFGRLEEADPDEFRAVLGARDRLIERHRPDRLAVTIEIGGDDGHRARPSIELAIELARFSRAPSCRKRRVGSTGRMVFRGRGSPASRPREREAPPNLARFLLFDADHVELNSINGGNTAVILF